MQMSFRSAFAEQDISQNGTSHGLAHGRILSQRPNKRSDATPHLAGATVGSVTTPSSRCCARSGGGFLAAPGMPLQAHPAEQVREM